MTPATTHMIEWLLGQGRLLPGPGVLLASLCRHLNRHGMELLRANVQSHTLHPEVGIMLYIWNRPGGEAFGSSRAYLLLEREDPMASGEVKEANLLHGALESDVFHSSPFYRVVEHGDTIRATITANQKQFDYPILEDMRRVGATGYLALPLDYSSGTTSAISFATERAGGFSDEQVEMLVALSPILAMCFEHHSQNHIRRSLLRTYLGAHPGALVQEGHVRPGDVRRIEAAILFSDIRGFTDLSAQMDSRALIDTLNGYFSVVASALEEHGGEILKFIGDALLVVFPVDEERDSRRACNDALLGTLEASRRLVAWNGERVAQGEDPLQHGFGLHLGQAEFGNIGSQARLDFTVIGRDVNVASRVESMCKSLKRDLLASQSFVGQVDDKRWRALGEYHLKGVPEPQTLYALEAE